MDYGDKLKKLRLRLSKVKDIFLSKVSKGLHKIFKFILHGKGLFRKAFNIYVPALKNNIIKTGIYFKKEAGLVFKWIVKWITKENAKKLVLKIKGIFSKEKMRTGISKIKSILTKENLQAVGAKIRKILTKEGLKNLLCSIRYCFTKDNFKKIASSIKNNVLAYKKAYITFIVLLIAALPITFYFKKYLATENEKAVVAKYVITNNKAEEYYYKGEYDKAIEEYISLASKDENEGLWYAKISEIYSVKGDIENSRQYVDKAYKLSKSNSEVLNYIIFTELMNKDYSSALIHGEEALKQFSKDKKLIKTMFTVYMANKDLAKAKSIISNYPLSNGSAYDRAEYAMMLMIIGNKEDGFKQLKLAWFTDKDEYKVYDVLAQLSLYDRDELLEYISDLSENEPNTTAYKMWLAKIYSLNESTASEAEKILDEMESEDTGKIVIKLIKAAVLQNTKQNEKAEQLLSEVIDSNMDDYRVLHTAGWYYLNKKDYAQADSYCRQSIIKNKDYTDNYGFLMPEILKAQNKTMEGEPYFRTALYKEPYNYNVMLTLADYYWHTAKNSSKAMEYFKLAEIVMPYEPEIKYDMAFIDISNNKIEDAIELLKQCVKLSDSTPKYHRTLGTVYIFNNKPKEAIKEIRYAYGSDQEDILTLNNAGCYYISQEANLSKGEFNLRKAVEGITDKTDKETADMIRENYKRAKDLLDKYNGGKSNQTLKIPDFQFFY